MREFLQETTETLRKCGVSIVYLFGSQVEGNQTEKSDIDLGVVFYKEKSQKEIIELHPELYSCFVTEFSATFEKEVDIVYLQNCSVSFQYYVIRNNHVFYETSPFFRVNYEEHILKEYLDFKPIAEIFSKALLERI